MLNRQTRRLYYERPYLSSCTAGIVRLGTDHIEMDQTIAFPEGGGQEPDQGSITVEGGITLRYIHVKKMYSMPGYLAHLPDVQVGGVIWHVIAPDDQPLLAQLREGQQARVEIDVARRARLALSHTASHLLYLGIAAHRPDTMGATLGCHIKTDGARFDFQVDERFRAEELLAISDTANHLVKRALPIEVFADEGCPDARYWRCDGQTIPCGGMHLVNTVSVGELRLRRKSLGTGKERVSCEFPFALVDLAQYGPNQVEGNVL
jgi:Ser-tRNA(Ala) deacylase AlaX